MQSVYEVTITGASGCKTLFVARNLERHIIVSALRDKIATLCSDIS